MMNRGWQLEQEQFLEKQQARRCVAGSSLHAASCFCQPKFKGAYTRDPNELFLGVASPPPPMNADGRGHLGVQPVKFCDVYLAVPIACHGVGAHFSIATVNFLTGFTQLFTTEADYLRETAVFSGFVRLQSSPLASYREEVVAFLSRGHSLLAPTCRCTHGLGAQRAMQLGIHASGGIRDGRCTLPRQVCPRTAQEIAAEIAVSDIYCILDRSGRSVAGELCDHESVALLRSDVWDHFLLKRGLGAVTDKQSLLQLVNDSEGGVTPASSTEQYQHFERDIHDLAQQGLVYAIYNDELGSTVAFKRNAEFDLQVSSEIRQLWDECAPLSRISGAREMDCILRTAGLQPTKQGEPDSQRAVAAKAAPAVRVNRRRQRCRHRANAKHKRGTGRALSRW